MKFPKNVNSKLPKALAIYIAQLCKLRLIRIQPTCYIKLVEITI